MSNYDLAEHELFIMLKYLFNKLLIDMGGD